MHRSAYRALMKATAGEDADHHTVLLALSAREIRRIAAYGRMVRRHRMSTMTVAWGFTVWEGTSLIRTVVADPTEIDAWIAKHGAEGDLRTDTDEIVIGFAGASIWLSFRVKGIDGREWQTDSMPIADLAAAVEQLRTTAA